MTRLGQSTHKCAGKANNPTATRLAELQAEKKGLLKLLRQVRDELDAGGTMNTTEHKPLSMALWVGIHYVVDKEEDDG